MINKKKETFQEKIARIQASIPLQLPLWPESDRGAPSAIIRSALFGVVKKGRRKAMKRERVASWKDVEINYTGWQLDQADLDVWLQALHIASQGEIDLGGRIRIFAKTFLRDINRSSGKPNRTWLMESFSRLKANSVSIKIGYISYNGSLIDEFYHDEETGEYAIEINKKLEPLFRDDYVRIEWETRQKLSGDLTKWLHAYVCSHKATDSHPHWVGLEKLKELCGVYEDREIKKFKYDVSMSMEKLSAEKVVSVWSIKDGILFFSRPPKKTEGVYLGPS